MNPVMILFGDLPGEGFLELMSGGTGIDLHIKQTYVFYAICILYLTN